MSVKYGAFIHLPRKQGGITVHRVGRLLFVIKITNIPYQNPIGRVVSLCITEASIFSPASRISSALMVDKTAFEQVFLLMTLDAMSRLAPPRRFLASLPLPKLSPFSLRSFSKNSFRYLLYSPEIT